MPMDFERRYKADGSSELYAKLPSGKWHGVYAEDNIEVADAKSIIDKLYVQPSEPIAPTAAEQLDAGDQGPIKRLSEDLVDALIAKGIIVASDLTLQTEYTARKILRGV